VCTGRLLVAWQPFSKSFRLHRQTERDNLVKELDDMKKKLTIAESKAPKIAGSGSRGYNSAVTSRLCFFGPKILRWCRRFASVARLVSSLACWLCHMLFASCSNVQSSDSFTVKKKSNLRNQFIALLKYFISSCAITCVHCQQKQTFHAAEHGLVITSRGW